jgi:hypothetical protein
VSTVRAIEVQYTHEYSGGNPDWTKASLVTLAPGVASVTQAVLGDTLYAVRTRQIDVFGNASAWSDVEEHTTATGPDGVAIQNTTATVTIDETGITILDGALTFEDANGSTILNGDGFGPAWMDFINNGLFNSTFQEGPLGAVTANSIPNWTATLTNATAAVVADDNFPSGRMIEVTPTALNGKLVLLSDIVPATTGFMSGSFWFGSVLSGTSVGFYEMEVQTYLADGATVATAWHQVTFNFDFAPGIGGWKAFGNAFSITGGERYVQVRMTMTEETAHSSATRLRLGFLAIKESIETAGVDPNAELAFSGLTVNNYAQLPPVTTLEGLAPTVYSDTGAAGTATITTAGTYYGITSLTTAAFTPTIDSPGNRKYHIEGTISIHHNSATRQHATIQWCIMESDGTTLVTAMNYTRHEQSAASEYHTHHFSGIWTATDENAKRFRPRFTVETTNGAVITAAFVSLIVTPLPY